MELTFRKEGVVTVGSYDEINKINLQDPYGRPIEVNFNLETEMVHLSILSWDDRNSVVRHYDFPMPTMAWLTFLQAIFEPYIREIAKANFPEFEGLTQLYDSITINGTTYPVSKPSNGNT